MLDAQQVPEMSGFVETQAHQMNQPQKISCTQTAFVLAMMMVTSLPDWLGFTGKCPDSAVRPVPP